MPESRREKYDRITTSLRGAKKHLEELGPLLVESKQERIWEEGGFNSLKEWIEKEIGISRSWAYELMGKVQNQLPETSETSEKTQNDTCPVTGHASVEKEHFTKGKPSIRPNISSEKSDKTEEVRLDSVGRKIPEQIVNYWERRDEVNAILTEISRLKTLIESAKRSDDMLWREVTGQDAVNALVRAYDEVKLALPYAVCPYCHGLTLNECQHCRGKGWMSRFAWKTFVPEEMKQLIEAK